MQLPTVKFVANELLTALHNRAVTPRLQSAVTHLKRAALGGERKQLSHVVAVAIEVGQPFPEYQHPAAFGIDRPLLRELP